MNKVVKFNRKSKERIVYVFFAFFICTYNNLYFMWSSYDSQIISSIFKLLQHLLVICLLAYALYSNETKLHVRASQLLAISMGLVIFVHVNFMGAEYYNDSILLCFDVIFAIIALFKLNVVQKTNLYETVLTVFAIITLPSLIYYVLYLIGMNIPYSVLASDNAGKVARGIWYMHFPFGLLAREPYTLARYCGLFDEPGVVGTMCALLFAGGYRRCNKKILMLILVEGIMSLSMAFYLLLIIFFIAEAFNRGAFKLAITGSILVLLLYVFINGSFENELLLTLQKRIDFSSFFLVKDNRTSEMFDRAYQQFIDEGGYSLFMGKGGFGAYANNPQMFGANSYKCIIYDLGIIGFIEYICFFVICIFTQKWRKDYIPFLAVFVASVYQRAYVFKASWVCIFILTLSYINYREVERSGRELRSFSDIGIVQSRLS